MRQCVSATDSSQELAQGGYIVIRFQLVELCFETSLYQGAEKGIHRLVLPHPA